MGLYLEFNKLKRLPILGTLKSEAKRRCKIWIVDIGLRQNSLSFYSDLIFNQNWQSVGLIGR